MNLNEYYTDFCAGCGLCHSKDVLYEEKVGFNNPVLQLKGHMELCKEVCSV